MRDSPIIKGCLLLGCIAAAIWYAHGISMIVRQSSFTDFGVFFHAGEKLWKGKPIYDAAEMRAFTFAPVYKYPPFWASLLQFFSPLGLRATALGWLILSQFFYFGSFALLIRYYSIPFNSIEFYSILLMFLYFEPTIDSMNGPQMDALFLFVLTSSWVALRRQRYWLSGFILGFMTMIKISPGFMAIHFVLARRWRALQYFILSLLILTGVSVFLAGTAAHKDYLFHALPASIGSTAYVENQSLFGVVARFFVDGNSYQEGKATVLPIAKWLTIFASMGIVAVTSWIGRKSNREDILYSSLIAVLLLILPFSWVHYEPVLLFPLTVLFCYLRTKERDAAGWLGLMFSYLLLAFGSPETMPGIGSLAGSYKFFAIVLLWCLSLRAMRDKSEAVSRLQYEVAAVQA
jgi:hypothetical protein